jgi:hypothetical protein
MYRSMLTFTLAGALALATLSAAGLHAMPKDQALPDAPRRNLSVSRTDGL